MMPVTTADGAVTAFSLAHPEELDERKQALHLLHVQQIADGPCPIVCDKGFAGAGIEKAACGTRAGLGGGATSPATWSDRRATTTVRSAAALSPARRGGGPPLSSLGPGGPPSAVRQLPYSQLGGGQQVPGAWVGAVGSVQENALLWMRRRGGLCVGRRAR